MAGLWTISRDRPAASEGGAPEPAGSGDAAPEASAAVASTAQAGAARTDAAAAQADAAQAGAELSLDEMLARAGYLTRRSAALLAAALPDAPAPADAMPDGPGSARRQRTTAIRVRKAARRAARARVSNRHALAVFVITVLAGTALVWTTVHLARVALTAHAASARLSPAPGLLVVPAPPQAGNLPLRTGPIYQVAERQVLRAFRHRFSAAAYAADGGDTAAVHPGGIYGEPGHIDTATGHTAWILYLGLGTRQELGDPATAIGRLLTGLEGTRGATTAGRVTAGRMTAGSAVPVLAGARGGAAACTVATIAGVKVAACGWATQHSAGVLVSPLSAGSTADLAALMLAMRPSLQDA